MEIINQDAIFGGWVDTPANVLPVSRRERWQWFENGTDLVREAVGCTGVLGRSHALAAH